MPTVAPLTLRQRTQRLCCLALGCWIALGAAGCGDDTSDAAPDNGATSTNNATNNDTTANTTNSTTTPNNGGEVSTLTPEGCNPLGVGVDCMLPYPSDVFRVPDPALPAGFRVELTDAALPQGSDGAPVDPRRGLRADGFSQASPLMVVFPEGVSAEGLTAAMDDYGPTLTPESPTLVLRADTGEPVPHFAEPDARATDDARRILFVRPAVRLEHGTRYIVAVRGLKNDAGGDIAPLESFRKIRDRATGGDAVIDGLAEHYEADIFPVLEGFGVQRDGLLAAWDFTTQSEQSAIGAMIAMRDDAVAQLDAEPPTVTITSVIDDPGEGEPDPEDFDTFVGRQVEGTIAVPMYLDAFPPEGVLVRDADGMPVRQPARADVPFRVIIPKSVMDGTFDGPRPLIHFSHGFFGYLPSVTRFMAEEAHLAGWVVMIVEWWGLSYDSAIPFGERLTFDTENVGVAVDQLQQAIVNNIGLSTAALTTLRDVDALKRDDGSLFYDPDTFYYKALSLGQIVGTTHFTLSPHHTRASFSIGGSNISLMLFRASPLFVIGSLIKTPIADAMEQQKFGALFQNVFDPVEPSNYMTRTLTNTLPGCPPERHMLVQVGIGDSEVPNLASHHYARSMGLPLIQPSPRSIFGLAPLDAPTLRSAYTEFDYGLDPLPGAVPDYPGASTGVHESLGYKDAVRAQVRAFFEPEGQIVHPCGDVSCYVGDDE